MSNENTDINLLKNVPDKLVLRYIPVIRQIISKNLVSKGYFSSSDTEDLVQETVEGLLRDMPNILKCYNGYSAFKPFFIRIIINKCNELRRKKYRQEKKEVVNDSPDNPKIEKRVIYSKKNDFIKLEDELHRVNNNNTDRKAILDSELDYLEVVFRMYPLQKVKLFICLKVFSGRQITIEELKEFNNNCEKHIYNSVIVFMQKSEKQTNEKAYQVLTDFFNHCDGTYKGKDAIRKWINKMVDEIVIQMNCVSIPPVYNKENIMGLIEMYFDRNS
jgi:RNA polymerase sigma factor (sigma-70 family)